MGNASQDASGINAWLLTGASELLGSNAGHYVSSRAEVVGTSRSARIPLFSTEPRLLISLVMNLRAVESARFVLRTSCTA